MSVLIIGKPNSGKTLLFNKLTGLRQKVANFPGVTVEVKKGRMGETDVYDYPGIYSLDPLTKDEELAVEKFKEALNNDDIKVVVCNLDVTRLERSLVMGLQAQSLATKHNKPFIFTLNMMDEMMKKQLRFDLTSFQKALGSPVYPVSARTNLGIKELREALLGEVPMEDWIAKHPLEDKEAVLSRAKALSKEFCLHSDILLKNQNALDRFFLNGFLGGASFFLIMALLFQAIFTWAAPLMDLVESSIEGLGALTVTALPEGVLRDFITDALFGGLGSFLVFVPQIMVLTFIIGLLEDSGYLARAAVICHRPLSAFGLTGRSFVPYLSGFACAIPAMMAARTIESPRKRMITLLTIPLMACSARLPVYSLLIVALIPDKTFLGSLFSYQGLAFMALYIFGLTLALLISALLDKFMAREDKGDSPFMIEMPPYRIPHLRPLLHRVYNAGYSFVVKAGPVIFSVTLVVWILGYFPQNGNLASSWLGRMGQFIEPVFSPLGLDWKYGVAVLASFLAREVFVGTLGTLFGIEGADENISGLAENIQAAGLTLGSGIGLLVFYAVALQCASTVAMMKKETGSHKMSWTIFGVYTVTAYVLALLTKLGVDFFMA